MSFKMIDKDQVIKVFNFRSDTNEFIGGGDAHIPAHTGLPAYCTDVKPPEAKAGTVPVFNEDSNKWSVVEDHRNETVYDVVTGLAILIYDLGPVPEGTTTAAPTGPYDVWSGSEWVVDAEKLKAAMIDRAESQRQSLMDNARDIVSDWKTELELGEISDEDKESLKAWMAYIKDLKGMNFDGVATEDDLNKIEWPVTP
ncbi:TPA: tail fiber assembly protein [Enterobacter roggenkampii]|nr:tail fiber assembly protein [Enterobacter roggenkampii]